jgi:hypothetical protein
MAARVPIPITMNSIGAFDGADGPWSTFNFNVSGDGGRRLGQNLQMLSSHVALHHTAAARGDVVRHAMTVPLRRVRRRASLQQSTEPRVSAKHPDSLLELEPI